MIARLAIASVMFAPVPVIAQSDTGTRLAGHPAQIPEHGTRTQRARIWLERYVACVDRRDSKGVSMALDASFESEDAALGNLSRGYFDDCLSGGLRDDPSELRMTDTLLRGALYAERVNRQVHRLTPEMLPRDTLALPDAASAGAKAARVSVIRFGECVVHKDPVNSLAFVKAEAGSGREDKALAVLGPAFGECVNAGTTVKLSRSNIEAALAEAIYRMTAAPDAAIRTSGN